MGVLFEKAGREGGRPLLRLETWKHTVVNGQTVKQLFESLNSVKTCSKVIGLKFEKAGREGKARVTLGND